MCYLSCSDGVSCKASSDMCGSWYFLKFLLSDGSLTWMYMVTFVFLVTLCNTLSTILKTLRVCWVSCGMAKVVYWGWGSKMFLKSVTKWSSWFPYVLLWAVDAWGLKPVYGPTFLELVVPVIRGHEKGFNGVALFEVHLDPEAVAGPFELLPKSVYVWYHYGDVFAVWSIVVGVVGLATSGCLSIVDVVSMGWICFVDCWYPMAGNCKPVGLS